MTLTSTGTQSAGAALLIQNGHNCGGDHLAFGPNLNWPVRLEGGAQQYEYHLTNFEINGGLNGIVVGSSYLVQDLWLSDGEIASCTGQGILLLNVSGYYFRDIDIIKCGYGFTTFPSVGQQCTAGFVHTVLCDTCNNNGFNILTNGGGVFNSDFIGCWASSNGTALAGPTLENGISINAGTGNISAVCFAEPQCTNNVGAGIAMYALQEVSIDNPHVFCNSTIGSAVRSGIEVAANVGSFSIVGGFSGKGGLFPTNNQAYGINVATGASAGYVIRDVNVLANVTGGIFDGGTGGGVGKTVAGNFGYTNSGRGEQQILSGNASLAFNHGLSVTPNVYDILLTPMQNRSSVGITSFWVSATSATQITVTANAAVSGNFFFVWDAKSAGA